ncbi:MAG: hypothetical protein ACKV1O_14355, partial [Saprospiraceae bacterium]
MQPSSPFEMAQGKATFLFFNLLLFGFLNAQTPLSKPVDFFCQDCRPADALVILSRQSGVNIVFSDRFFENCQPITVQAKNEAMKDVLEGITACGRVLFKEVGDQIVFYKKASKFTLSGYVQDAETGERLIGAS